MSPPSSSSSRESGEQVHFDAPTSDCTRPVVTSDALTKEYINLKYCYTFRYPAGDTPDLPPGDSVDDPPLSENSEAVEVNGFEVSGSVLSVLSPEAIKSGYGLGNDVVLIPYKLDGARAFHIALSPTEAYYVETPAKAVLEIHLLSGNLDAANILESFKFIK